MAGRVPLAEDNNEGCGVAETLHHLGRSPSIGCSDRGWNRRTYGTNNRSSACPCPRIISSRCGTVHRGHGFYVLTSPLSMKSSPVVDGDPPWVQNVPSLTSPTRDLALPLQHGHNQWATYLTQATWSMFGPDGHVPGTDRNSAWPSICAPLC